MHAIAVHLPIALAIIELPLVYLCAVVAQSGGMLRGLTFFCYALLAAGAY